MGSPHMGPHEISSLHATPRHARAHTRTHARARPHVELTRTRTRAHAYMHTHTHARDIVCEAASASVFM